MKRNILLKRLAMLLLALQFVFGLLVIGRVAEPFSVASGVRNDSSNSIGVVQRSTLWQHNGYGQYGPLYYRLAWTLDKFSPLLGKGSPWKWGGDREIHYNMVMMSISWASLFAVSALLMAALTRERLHQLLGTSLLVTAFSCSIDWANLVIVARPDLLLCFLGVLATWWSLRLLPESGLGPRKPLVMAAMFWGLCLCTKLSALVYLAVWPLFFLAWPIHRRVLPGLLFLLVVFLAYLIPGLPQTGDFIYLFRYVPDMATSNNAPTGSMPEMNWGGRLITQGGPPFLMLLVVGLLLRQPSTLRWNLWAKSRAAVFAIFPIGYMFTKSVASPSDHYLLLYIATALLIVAALIAQLPDALRLPERWVQHPLAGILLLCAALVLPRGLPDGFGRASANEIAENHRSLLQLNVVEQLQAAGKRLYLDPYVPHDPVTGSIHWTFRANMGMLEKDGYDVLVLRRFYYERYLVDEPSYYLHYFFRRSWKASREFYRFLLDRDDVVSPDGTRWTREIREGLEIWSRVTDVAPGP